MTGNDRRDPAVPSAPITAAGRPFDPSRQALNPLDGALHPHHPVMRRILPQRFDWAALRASTGDDASDPCTHSSPRGPIAHWDGELIVDNPRFVNVSMGFSMADAAVKIDLLESALVAHE